MAPSPRPRRPSALQRIAFRDPERRERRYLADVLRQETVGGSLLLATAVLALVWANTPWADAYFALRDLQLGPLTFEQWAADGLLAIFFYVAGVELKRELVVGSLSKLSDAAVPVVAALGGMVVPALIYVAVNLRGGDLGGWAVPMATDIAFALAVLAVMGSALPAALRAFLLTLAVVDDLGAIVVIAAFFTSTLHWADLGVAAALLAVFVVLQHLRVRSTIVYLPLALAVWWFVHEAGIHATVAGVLLGLLTRVRRDDGEEHSPAERVEHRLRPVSAGFAVPVFALASAGVAVEGGLGMLANPVAVGIMAGLVLGKTVGVLAGAWITTRWTHAELNPDLAWRDIAAVAMLSGVGFTVSLLIAELAFTGDGIDTAKLAVLTGSLGAATIAAVLLRARNRHYRRLTPAESGTP